MTWVVVLSLIVIGIVFLLLEILVVPGTTVVGILGLASMVTGVVVSFLNYGTQTGLLILGATLVFSVLSIVLALKSNTWKKAMLSSSMDGRVNVFEADKVLPGDEGKTVTRLNPYGKALIKDEYYEVVSKNQLIDEDTEIVVTKVEGNKIIVKPKS